MTTRARRLAYAAGWALGIAALLWFFFGSVGAPDERGFLEDPAMTEAEGTGVIAAPPVAPNGSDPAAIAGADGARAVPRVTPGDTSVPLQHDARGRRYVSYAIGVHDLQGLSPDTPAGARLELWAAWDPPLVEEPRVQRLVNEVVLEKIIPPTLPEGPHVALLSLRPRDVPRLIYGDQWARLSVVMLEPQG